MLAIPQQETLNKWFLIIFRYFSSIMPFIYVSFFFVLILSGFFLVDLKLVNSINPSIVTVFWKKIQIFPVYCDICIGTTVLLQKFKSQFDAISIYSKHLVIFAIALIRIFDELNHNVMILRSQRKWSINFYYILSHAYSMPFIESLTRTIMFISILQRQFGVFQKWCDQYSNFLGFFWKKINCHERWIFDIPMQ